MEWCVNVGFWVPLVILDQCPVSAVEALVEYDQWHPVR